MINYIPMVDGTETKTVRVDTDKLTEAQYFRLFPLLWEDTVTRFCEYHGIDRDEVRRELNKG